MSFRCRAVACLVLALGIVRCGFSAEAAADNRTPVPSRKEQRSQAKALSKAYEELLAQKRLEDRFVNGRRLLADAMANPQPAAKWVLLFMAIEEATVAEDVRTVLEAAEYATEFFQVDPIEHIRDVLDDATQKIRREQTFALYALAYDHLADLAAQRENYAIAERIMKDACSLADKSSRDYLKDDMKTQRQAYGQIAGLLKNYQSGLVVLERDPKDSRASRYVGLYLCFVNDDWSKGLPLLAQCDDEKLAQMAKLDLQDPADVPTRCQLSKDYWRLSEDYSQPARRHLQNRSLNLLKRIQMMIPREDHLLLRQRLARIQYRPQYEQGLLVSYCNDADLKGLLRTEIHPLSIDETWGLGEPAMLVPSDEFGVRFSGYLHIPEPGEYSFYLVCDDGGRLWLNGTLLLDAWDGHGGTSGASIQLKKGDYPIRVEHYDLARQATLRLLWARNKGKREIVPGTFLLHDRKQALAAKATRMRPADFLALAPPQPVALPPEPKFNPKNLRIRPELEAEPDQAAQQPPPDETPADEPTEPAPADGTAGGTPAGTQPDPAYPETPYP